jgi:predicted phosphodiesterase
MKSVKIDLPASIETITVEVFFDLHIGSPKCDTDLIKERIERVKNNPNTYCIIGGDIINNSTKTSVGDVYSEPLSPMAQITTAIELFKPIKDKIIGCVSGNHERRTYKQDGIDLIYFMCTELGIVDRYAYGAELLFIRFGVNPRDKRRKMCYTVYLTHGDGQGGRLIGGKANGLQRRGRIVNSDIVITGHTHTPFTFRENTFVIDYQNSTVNEREQVFINASATLNYEEYAELYGLPPSSKISPRVILDGRKKTIIVMM